MDLHAVIERVWRCTCRPRPSELGDAIGGRDRATLEMYSGGRDRVSLEMHMEAVIDRDWRSPRRRSIWRR